jgi:peptide/nickel transport system substrate-binding protein
VAVRTARGVVGTVPMALAVAALISLPFLTACSRTGEPTQARTAATLKMGVGQPGNAHVRLATTMVADGLFGLAWDGRPVERVVSALEWSQDRRTLSLTLRPGLTWHDGTPVEIAHLQHTITNAIKDAQAPSLKSITDVSVDPKKPDTVKVKLSRPEAFLVEDLATSTLRHPTNERLGTGPYKFGAETKDSVFLEAFDKYFRGVPKLQQIELRNYRQSRAAWAALMRGEVDAVHEYNVDVKPPDSVRSFPFVRPYFIQLVFNTRHPALRNRIVRQALSYSIDRQMVVDEAMDKQGAVADGPIWPYHWAYSTAQKTYTHNLEAARLRLESAALTVKPGKPGRMPSRLHIRCITPGAIPQFEKIALLLQKQFYEIGIDLEIIELPADEAVKRLESSEFETVLILRTSGRSLSSTYATFHSSISPGGYSAADSVLDRLRNTTNESEIRAAVSDLQQIFHDDPPAIFIAWQKTARVVNTRYDVPGEGDGKQSIPGSGRDVLSSIWLWQPRQ